MRYIDGGEVHRLVRYPDLIGALAAMYREGCDSIERMTISQPTRDGDVGDCLIQPAWMRGKALGIKIANAFPENVARRQLPSVMGLYVLFDGNSGLPLACIDGTAETYLKTACNSAVAADLLARRDASTLVMMGAGNLAPYLIQAHAAVRKPSRVIIWNRRPETAEKLAGKMLEIGLPAEAVRDADEAVSQGDLVCCATYANEPILKGAWLKAGAHVDLVGGYRPDQREADDEVAKRAGRIYVDTRVTTVGVAGDVIEPLKNSLVSDDRVMDLFELSQGRVAGRQSESEVTMFKSGGGGHEDLATALMIYEMSLKERPGAGQ